ncbi:dockerin type I domain-containing protein [Natronospora cellulosivora (SeqCode)]
MFRKKILFLISLFFIFYSVFSVQAVDTVPYEWNNVAIGGGGFVSAIISDPNDADIFYARTDVGGAYRWDESTQSWIALMDWVDSNQRGLLGIEAIAVDPNQKGTVYMMAGTVYWNQANDGIGRSAFLRSNDYGETWDIIYLWDDDVKKFNVHGNGMGRGTGEALAVDPADSNIIYYGTRNKGLWKSTDNGDNWSQVESFPIETTWNGAGISFVEFDQSTIGDNMTSRIYVGVLEDHDNVFYSEDAGETWSLLPNRPVPMYAERIMPQRIAIRPDGSAIYITFGDGAGPHTMQWDEGWGPINDWYNRGAVFKYELATETWTDISPQNFINPDGEDYADPSTYLGCYSGISIDPNNPDRMVVSSIASYRGPQFWLIDGQWEDRWGDNIYVTEDGGETWIPSFEYYWLDGGMEPHVEQMDENGVPWIVGNTIHWIGSVQMDPNNPSRVFVTSGNGVYMTEDIFNYETSDYNDWGQPEFSYTQETVWKFAGHGIEETVPQELVSIPDGPMVSVILDYDGFVHEDVTEFSPYGRHTTSAAGAEFHLGNTTDIVYAPQAGILAKVARTRSVSTQYTEIPIGPVQYSEDNGKTWTVETYTSNPPEDLYGGSVALSADGEVTLWMPSSGKTMYRRLNTTWTEVEGIDFNSRPVADWVNPNVFYIFNRDDGYLYLSTDKGQSFTQASYVGNSRFYKARTVPEVEGHIWVPLATTTTDGTREGALMRSYDGGETFTPVPGVGYTEAVGFGKAAEGSNYPTIFAYAEIDGVLGVFRSIDQGNSWVRVNDDDHEYGGLANGEFVIGDMNVFGRVYMSTAGRGIVYGEPLSEEPIPEIIIGDVDGNGVIDLLDYVLLSRYILTIVPDDMIIKEAADINGDGVINSQDASLLMRYLLTIDSDL